jgi:hypothetical protein
LCLALARLGCLHHAGHVSRVLPRPRGSRLQLRINLPEVVELRKTGGQRRSKGVRLIEVVFEIPSIPSPQKCV